MIPTMRLVSAQLAVLALRRSGVHITSATLRSWVYRGHITRHPEGYDLREIVTYVDTRTRRV